MMILWIQHYFEEDGLLPLHELLSGVRCDSACHRFLFMCPKVFVLIVLMLAVKPFTFLKE